MCELLIYAKNNTNPLAHQRGNIVTVHDDGWPWTIEESKAAWVASGRLASQWHNIFILVKMPGVPKARIENMKLGQDDVTGNLLRKRQFFVDIDATPSQIKQKIGRDFEITVTKAQLRNFFKRRGDGVVHNPGWGD